MPRTAPTPLGVDDVRITDARYGVTLALVRCDACGFVYAADDDLARLPALYAALDDPTYADQAPPRQRQMAWLLARVARHRPAARSLLDVGAGTGFLVEAAARRGWEGIGVEPSAPLAARARASGRPVLAGGLPHPALGARRFDVVTLVDVVEHVADPVTLLRDAARHLAPGGALLVVTPDVAAWAPRVLGARWWHYRIAHVGYFDRHTLRQLATRAGLRVAAIARPRWFLPIGYLAERLASYAGPFGAALRGIARRLPDVALPFDPKDSLWVLCEHATAHD
jgi:SAM-dependent methyltransferase